MLKSLLRSLLRLFVLALVTVVAFLYFLPKLLPEDKLRDTVVRACKDVTGRTMALSHFTFAVLPAPFFEARDVQVSDPAHADAPTLTIPFLRADLDPMDILRNRITAKVTGTVTQGAAGIRTLSGTVSFPTAALHNRGGENRISLALGAPLPLTFEADVQADARHFTLRNAIFAFAHTHGEGSFEGDTAEMGDTYKGEWRFSMLDADELLQAKPQLQELAAGARAVGDIAAALAANKPRAATPTQPKPEQAAAVQAMSKDEAATWLDTPVPLNWLLLMNADIMLAADAVRYNGFTHEHLTAKFSAKNGTGTLALKGDRLYGGKGAAEITADAAGAREPQLKQHIKLHDADVGQFLQDVYQLDRVAGKGDVTVDAAASGRSMRDIVGSLSGRGSIAIRDGILKDIDILGMANPTPAILSEALYETDKDTKITDLNATFSMTEGILANNDLVLNVPFVRLTGRGTLDFLEMSVKYHVIPTVGVNRIGLTVPLLLEGSLAHPTVLPDVTGIATQGVDDAILQAKPVKAVTDTVGKGLKSVPGVGDLLDALPGGELKRAKKTP